MIKLTGLENTPFWVKATSILFVQGKAESGSVIMVDQVPGLLDCTESPEEIIRSIRETVLTVIPHPPVISVASTGPLDKSLWDVPPIIATEAAPEQETKTKRHAKQGESIEIIGQVSRHKLDIGTVCVVVLDADVDGSVVADGQFVEYVDYVVLNTIPKLEAVVVEPEEEPEVVEPTYQLVKRVATGGETIEITGNTGSHKVRVGTHVMAIADAMVDKSVIAAGQFIPYDDYSVVEFAE
jgi:hypothetical protein